MTNVTKAGIKNSLRKIEKAEKVLMRKLTPEECELICDSNVEEMLTSKLGFTTEDFKAVSQIKNLLSTFLFDKDKTTYNNSLFNNLGPIAQDVFLQIAKDIKFMQASKKTYDIEEPNKSFPEATAPCVKDDYDEETDINNEFEEDKLFGDPIIEEKKTVINDDTTPEEAKQIAERILKRYCRYLEQQKEDVLIKYMSELETKGFCLVPTELQDEIIKEIMDKNINFSLKIVNDKMYFKKLD